MNLFRYDERVMRVSQIDLIVLFVIYHRNHLVTNVSYQMFRIKSNVER